MTLRQFGKGEFLGGLSYSGGIDDPTVWNPFVAEGRLGNEFEGLDIHISCPIPSDPEQAAKTLFYIDDVSLQAIEEPPLSVSTPLDEYYVGEAIPWTVSAHGPRGRTAAGLWLGERPIGREVEGADGAFETRGLEPGIYTVKATLAGSEGTPLTAEREVILAPDAFDWPRKQ
jgi:hypothetical protein